uniref:Uncharacterized protein n=2 Tax=Gopherus TaxID=38771 RepID=A0A8C4WIM8_9SAUR
MNWTGVHTFQFILSAPTSSRFMTKKKSSRKGGATTRRSSRSLLTMAKGTFDGISCSRYR